MKLLRTGRQGRISPNVAQALRGLPREVLAVLQAAYVPKGLERLVEALSEDGGQTIARPLLDALVQVVEECGYHPKRLPPSPVELTYVVRMRCVGQAAQGSRALSTGARRARPVPKDLERHCEAVALYCYDRLLERRSHALPPKGEDSDVREQLWRAALRIGRRIAVEMDPQFEEDIETLRAIWVEIPLPAAVWDAWAARRQWPPSRWYICYSLCPLPGPGHLHLGVEEWGY